MSGWRLPDSYQCQCKLTPSSRFKADRSGRAVPFLRVVHAAQGVRRLLGKVSHELVLIRLGLNYRSDGSLLVREGDSQGFEAYTAAERALCSCLSVRGWSACLEVG